MYFLFISDTLQLSILECLIARINVCILVNIKKTKYTISMIGSY